MLKMSVKPFKQAFCECFDCPPESYLREAFLRTLYPRAAPFGKLMLWFGATEGLQLLDEAGMSTSEEELLDIIRQNELDARERGLTLARRWKFRVSGQRLVELHKQVRSGKS